jgi:hypothetical protein
MGKSLEKKKFSFEITSCALHFLAMALMLSDHLWATVIPWQADWMTILGRLAFPIFAFMTVEGFFHTKNLKKYMLRMLIFALLSEIPFNLMMSGSVIYPFHQNVLWCFLLCVGLMSLNEKAKKTGKWWIFGLTAVGTFLLGTLVGMLSFMDYMQYGVWMVLTFYFFRGNKWWNYAAQLLLMIWINKEVGGMFYQWELFGHSFEFQQQSFAVFALIPIWLYNGKQGYHSKWLQYVYYAFYPMHLLILGLIKLL